MNRGTQTHCFVPVQVVANGWSVIPVEPVQNQFPLQTCETQTTRPRYGPPWKYGIWQVLLGHVCMYTSSSRYFQLIHTVSFIHLTHTITYNVLSCALILSLSHVHTYLLTYLPTRAAFLPYGVYMGFAQTQGIHHLGLPVSFGGGLPDR